MKKFLKLLLLMIIYIIVTLIILIKMDYINIEYMQPKKDINEYIDNGLNLEDATLNISKWKEDRFYYNQLSNTAKIIYDKVLENKENLKTGTAEIKFSKNEFDEILKEENGMEILSTEYQNAVDSIRYDHMDLFYVDFTKMALRAVTYTRGNNKTYEVYLAPMEEKENYLEDYIQNQNIDIMLDKIENKSYEILQNAKGSNYQKIQYIHNWLIDNIKYDVTYSNNNTRNIYGALIEKEVVCEGYSKAFKYLLDKLEIPCIIISGQAVNSENVQENHMWNYVQINSVWYAVDVTWDDPIIINGNELSDESRYRYFCQGDNINENHFIANKITEKGQEFIYPELYHKGE